MISLQPTAFTDFVYKTGNEEKKQQRSSYWKEPRARPEIRGNKTQLHVCVKLDVVPLILKPKKGFLFFLLRTFYRSRDPRIRGTALILEYLPREGADIERYRAALLVIRKLILEIWRLSAFPGFPRDPSHANRFIKHRKHTRRCRGCFGLRKSGINTGKRHRLEFHFLFVAKMPLLGITASNAANVEKKVLLCEWQDR